MGLRDKILTGVEQSKSLQIEFDSFFNPDKHFAQPGTRLSGHVVVRNPQPLSIGELRITVYGITDATIRLGVNTIQKYFFGRGFLFQEITTILQGPITLEPSSTGHRYPFGFTMPGMTKSMAENNANFINKFKPRPPFARAQGMHPLPPSFRCYKKLPYGHHES